MSDAKKPKLDSSTMRICTHSGSFHADESLAVYLLRLLPKFQGSQLVRSRNPTDWEESDIVVDVGGKYDGGIKWFDHHQREFSETFSQNFQTKLSSAGLIYKHFGKEIIQHVLDLKKPSDIELLYLKVYKEFIEAIDANDNGINNYPSDVEKKFNDKNLGLPALVSHLNPAWNVDPVDKDFDEAFEKASELMGLAFLNLVKGYGQLWLPARDIVEEAFKSRFDTIKFVLFSDSSSKWRISTVPVTSTSFEFRFGLPEPWRGVRDEELSKLTGVDGCIFVHAAGFIGGAETQDAVMELARLALESK